MIDNFKLIEPFFDFDEKDNVFFHCQIVQRAKDHKPNKVREGAIKTYFIKSKEHFNRIKDEIILLCEHYKARAYINIASKSFNDLQNLLLTKLVKNVTENIIQNPRKLLNSAAGELKSKRSLWVIDVDDDYSKNSILNWLDEYFQLDIPPHYYDRTVYLEAEIPTVQGIHLITKKFNLQAFHNKFPNIDVHKNSMGTLLYYPKSLEAPKYQCSVCGGTNIQLTAWVDPNDNNKYIEDTSDVTYWCEDCKDFTKIKNIIE